jgi:hypothetical protein
MTSSGKRRPLKSGLRGVDRRGIPPLSIPRVPQCNRTLNESLARYFCGGESAIGRRLITQGGADMQFVGVVSDAKHIFPRERKMMFHVPYRQDTSHLGQMVAVLRVAGSPLSVAAEARRELRELDPSLPVVRIGTVDEQLGDLLVTDRLIAKLSSFFGGLALLLACLGLYGVMSYTTARRTNEIGIRVALGATSGGVLRMVLKEGLALATLGITAGLPATWAVTRLIAARLFGLTPADPVTIAGATLLVITLAASAGFVPARRASRVDPMVALRHE